MRISETYSHINGLEYMLVHKPELWTEIQVVIATVNAIRHGRSSPPESTIPSVVGYDAIDLHEQFRHQLELAGWKEAEVDFWITRNERLARATVTMTSEEQRQRIETAGEIPIKGHSQIEFAKNRVGVEVQFGRHELVTYDLSVRHLSLYVSDQIDVGIEILPMKSLQSQMSSGVPYFEGEFYNVIRQGRGVPAVPLVIIGIEP